MSSVERTSGSGAGCAAATCGSEPGWQGRVRARIVSQFGHPRGPLGVLAGAVMAYRRSNVERSRWTVGLLDPRPDARILEIGFGPGVAIAEASRRAPRGLVVGIDHSEAMWRRASKRNRKAIERGQVRLMLGAVDALPAEEAGFDHVFAVNSIAFWPRPVEVLGVLAGRLRAGGTLAITEQPRSRGADASAAAAAGRRIAAQLAEAGLADARIETLPLSPAPAVCVLARASGLGPARTARPTD